jgi:hydroxymethylbilane synthase
MKIRLGTRDSLLAMWQANTVADALRGLGHEVDILSMKSEGDLVLDTPLPLMGGKGVFTKVLDDSLLDGSIHIAVHSHKDIPTDATAGLRVAAVLEREDPRDALVARNGLQFLELEAALIATGSVRRAGQWLHRHPGHSTTDLRGNVPTRLKKLENSDWDGAIFALAGLKRLGLEHRATQILDWMLPAPAQGAVAVMCRADDAATIDALAPLNHAETAACVRAERAFLNELNGGCSAPIGALAELRDGRLVLRGNVLTPDGRDRYDISADGDITDADAIGRDAARRILDLGAGWALRS